MDGPGEGQEGGNTLPFVHISLSFLLSPPSPHFTSAARGKEEGEPHFDRTLRAFLGENAGRGQEGYKTSGGPPLLPLPFGPHVTG